VVALLGVCGWVVGVQGWTQGKAKQNRLNEQHDGTGKNWCLLRYCNLDLELIEIRMRRQGAGHVHQKQFKQKSVQAHGSCSSDINIQGQRTHGNNALHEHSCPCSTRRCGQNHIHIYTVYTRHFLQGNHQIYGHIRCTYIYGFGQPYTPYAHKHSSTLRHTCPLTWIDATEHPMQTLFKPVAICYCLVWITKASSLAWLLNL